MTGYKNHREIVPIQQAVQRYQEIRSIALKDSIDITYSSPTGCGFQDAYSDSQEKWIKITIQDLSEHAEKYPDDRVRLSLISSCTKSYSVCAIKNIKIEFDYYVPSEV